MKLFKLKTLFALSRHPRAAKAPLVPPGKEDGDTFFMILDGEPVTFAGFNEQMARHFAPESPAVRADESCPARRIDE